MKGGIRECELCGQTASTYCNSDAAFLCFTCDSNVHNANFLVARHVRLLICPSCYSLTTCTFSGNPSTTSLHRNTICLCCSPANIEEPDSSLSASSSSTSSSSCISSAESKAFPTNRAKGTDKTEASSTKRNLSGVRFSDACSAAPGRQPVDAKTERIVIGWCEMLGLNANLIAPAATRAMGFCVGRMGRRALPFRVSLAASFWFGLRLCGDKSLSTWHNLTRLQEVSGVPARLIVAVETKLERRLQVRRSRGGLEEGWAECSV